ncbi:cellulose binding domain-containing protein [Luedemannella flava]
MTVAVALPASANAGTNAAAATALPISPAPTSGAAATTSLVDTQPPSTPGAPTASNITSTGFTATWGRATDNVGVAAYLLQYSPQGGSSVTITVTSGLTYTFTGLQPGTCFGLGVAAVDAAGNKSLSIAHPILYCLPTAPPPVTSAPPPAGCVATYAITGQWPGGFQAEVTVRNAGTTAFNAWTASWTFGGGQQISQLWNGSHTQSGAAVTVKNLSWNGSIPAGQSRTFGFLGSWNGTNPLPTPTCVGS